MTTPDGSTAPATPESLEQIVVADIWKWINGFVTVPNEFYNFRFPPCPYAKQAVLSKTVDVKAWLTGDVRAFIKDSSVGMRDDPKLTTRVMAFPPRIQFMWGINDFVESVNIELLADGLFLNTGVAKTSVSRYPGSKKDPYFIVVANSVDPVLAGAEALARTDYYKDWPASHYAIVVERRARMAKQFGKKK